MEIQDYYSKGIHHGENIEDREQYDFEKSLLESQIKRAKGEENSNLQAELAGLGDAFTHKQEILC